MAHEGDGDPDPTVVLDRNREQQATVYGESLGVLFGRLGTQLGLTQARIGGLLGLSAPMISQLASGRRVKIGNPMAVQRLQSLVDLGFKVTSGEVPAADVEARLADIAGQGAVVTKGVQTGGTPSARAAARAVQSLLRAVAGAEELLDAASMIEARHPDIAAVLRVYGAGRTGDAVEHYAANVDQM
ncbi:DNA-binding protein [Saccharothrix violaceirubra]|uniref:Transcriptional regulator with XRE-family HTH domain n=1 Tax=Saccharothrix violaceirubra TaxID=413306 RepID=A0A7W7T2C2_9PSEU|nr:DNA-binding protein [Saccharothrix violaceirubra]MBB4965317.1 transcriptional regulator with XRE-family HTH domain [Saccharothrix violaceirubra]